MIKLKKISVKQSAILFILAVSGMFIAKYIYVEANIYSLLNVDDMASIQFAFVGESFVDKIIEILRQDPTNVPIYYILLYVWIRVFGFAPETLHLLSGIFIMLTSFLMGIILTKMLSERMGLIATLVSAISLPSLYAGFQVRAYPLFVLGAACLLLAWIYHNEHSGLLSQVVYVISLLFISYTHFFGLLLSFSYGLQDLTAVIKKKKKPTYLLPYVVFCILYLPYLYVSYTAATKMYGIFWPPRPDYFDIVKMIVQTNPWGIVGLFFVVSAVIRLFQNGKSKITFEDSIVKKCIIDNMIVLIIAFVYSRYLNPSSSVWVYRYFLVLYPGMILITLVELDCFLQKIQGASKFKERQFNNILVSIVIVIAFYNINFAIINSNEVDNGGKQFEELKKYILVEDKADEEKAILYFPYPENYFDGWLTFYSNGNTVKSNNTKMVCTYNELQTIDFTDFNTIYTVSFIYDIDDEANNLICDSYNLQETDCDGIKGLNKYTRSVE